MSSGKAIVGVVLRPHGIRGDLVIELRTDEPERRFAVGATLQGSNGRDYRVRGARRVGDRFVIGLDPVVDRDGAEAIRQVVLTCRVDERESPEQDEEYYDRQLIGLRALDADAVDRGMVVSVLHAPAQDILEIEVAGTLRMVPFVKELVPEVDLSSGWLRLAPVAGLLDDEGL